MPSRRGTDGISSGWRSLLDALPDAAAVVDDLGRFVFTNARLHELTGYPPGALDGRAVDELVPEDARAKHREDMRRYGQRPSARSMGSGAPTSCRRIDGSTFPVDIALAPLPNTEGWTIAVIRDDSEHQRTEEELFRMATHDPLTHLANRQLLRDRFEQSSGRRSPRVSVLFLDLDRFKRVNDTYGHAAGDEVLRAAAGGLASTFRPNDTIARVGGDEFVVVCEDVSVEEATALAARAVAVVGERIRDLPFVAAAGVTASVGLACADAGEDLDGLLARADAAMYAAKNEGGNGFRVA